MMILFLSDHHTKVQTMPTAPAPKTVSENIYMLLQKATTAFLTDIEKGKIKKWINDLIPLSPAEAYDYKSRYDLLMGDIDSAISDAKNAIRLDEKNVLVIFNSAGVFFASGRYDEGLAIAQQAIELNPDAGLIRSLFNVAYILNNKASMDLCQEYYSKMAQTFLKPGMGVVRFAVNDKIVCLSRRFGKILFKRPIRYTVEQDADDYLALCDEFPLLYGSGETVDEAARSLEGDIEEVCLDLLSRDNFSQSFLDLKEQVFDMIEQELAS